MFECRRAREKQVHHDDNMGLLPLLPEHYDFSGRCGGSFSRRIIPLVREGGYLIVKAQEANFHERRNVQKGVHYTARKTVRNSEDDGELFSHVHLGLAFISCGFGSRYRMAISEKVFF